MIEETLKILDDTIISIKENDVTNSFNKKALQQFELTLFLCLDIVRYELKTTGKLSDIAAEAFNPLFVFGCFEFYYKDYPIIYSKTCELSSSLNKYNDKLNKDELKSFPNRNKDWINYFNKTLSYLLLSTTK